MEDKIKAAIFDMDGVVTRTAKVHANAWKKMFDKYNAKRKQEDRETYVEFSIEKDYPEYIDGIPRYKGVENFLNSRDINLPYGSPEDDPDTESICGLGNWKNEFFRELLSEGGVETYEENVEKLKKWRKEGVKTAIISSSKNCEYVLHAAGIEDLFDVRVDGKISEERGLKGKPDPDIFIAAANDLKVKPSDSLIIEDALLGVEAGCKGEFKIVVGIDSGKHKKEMLNRGADVVVKDLSDFNIKTPKISSNKLPCALYNFDEISEKINQSCFLFLDYDGTLTPIVDNHEDAIMTKDMRRVLREIAEKIHVAIVSGRDTNFIQENVGLEGLYYAGSHGFEIHGPDGFFYENEKAKEIVPQLDNMANDLKEQLKDDSGVKFERKKYALAVHLRHVNNEKNTAKVVYDVATDYDKLTIGTGKKILEIKPDIEWHKGKAVMALLDRHNHTKSLCPIYIGDDITDEDAFRSIRNGIGILVGNHGGETAANYGLEDVNEVKEFLRRLSDHF